MRRPSASSTVSSVSLTETPTARGTDLGLEVLTPCLQELLLVVDDHLPETAEFVPSEAPRVRQGYRVEPELGYPVSVLHVDLGRFSAVAAVEEEACGTDPSNRGHRCPDRQGSVPVAGESDFFRDSSN
jgi:hypothetical protein